MNETNIEIHMLNDHIFLIDDNGESTGYVVLGSKKALLIDTMYGRTDLKALVASITSLPVIVINTHGHIDHICGNACFDQPALINKKDVPIAEAFYDSPEMKLVFETYHCDHLKWTYIEPGEVIDLGDLTLEILEMPGHTPGSIGLLDRKDRILFSGDAVNAHIWMQLEESLPLPEFLKTLESLQEIRSEFDYLLAGHSKGMEEASRLDDLMRGVKEVIDGKTEQDIPYEYFDGVCKAHRYKPENPDWMIVYQ